MEEDSVSSESELEGEEEEVETDPSLPRLREPWYRVSDPCFVKELRREMCPQHILYGVQVKTVARRFDNDDVLFELTDHTHTLVGSPSPPINSPILNLRKAMVHLTWGGLETDPAWPSTGLFSTWAQWIDQIMVPEADERES